jgi:cell division protein FtsB
MPTRLRKKSRFAFFLLPLVFAAVTVYFGWQSTRGNFGEEARAVLAADRAAREAELAGLVAEREVLEIRVTRLRTDALDADLLDERIRDQLNMAQAHELVILHRPAPGGDARDLASAR